MMPLIAELEVNHLSQADLLAWVYELNCKVDLESIPSSGGRIWVNYSDLTATSLESWLVRGIIPKWP